MDEELQKLIKEELKRANGIDEIEKVIIDNLYSMIIANKWIEEYVKRFFYSYLGYEKLDNNMKRYIYSINFYNYNYTSESVGNFYIVANSIPSVGREMEEFLNKWNILDYRLMTKFVRYKQMNNENINDELDFKAKRKILTNVNQSINSHN